MFPKISVTKKLMIEIVIILFVSASNCSRSSCSECSSPCNNAKEKPANAELSHFNVNRAADTMSDNMLSTNFNQPDFKNFISQNTTQDVPKSIGNYVKPPQVPANFNKPPLPYVPPLPIIRMPNVPVQTGTKNVLRNPQFLWNGKPNMSNEFVRFSSAPSSVGSSIPDFRESSKFTPKEIPLRSNETNPDKFVLRESVSYRDPLLSLNIADSLMNPPQFHSIRRNPLRMEPKDFNLSRSSLNPSFVGFQNTIKPDLIDFKSSFVPARPKLAPTQPAVTFPQNFPSHTHSEAMSSKLYPISTSYSTSMPPPAQKKPQPKVKFSNTVTAFIVPEVKRPVRSAPPAHVTNPQKELADSLPLCHPNEDYLKDFAPVKMNEDGEENRNPPKIKVVHFGVV